MLSQEAARGQVVHLILLDRWIETPIEVFQALEFSKGGRVHPPRDLPVLPHQELVLQDQLQELGMGQVVARRFVQPHVERLGQAGEPQLAERRCERVVHDPIASFLKSTRANCP